MLSKLRNLFRPKPEFRVGQLVVLKREGEHPKRYLLIEGRRWLQPEGAKKSEWVYDGMTYHIEKSTFKPYSPISCASERSLELIPLG